ncbi:universal stress protein [Halomicroarcula sp. GCM10025817]|uniref:universal stress protein n=1 Tax=Haloarcula TaxID=2237 RepID=UPI0023E7BB89|nr:universal stress protein [Halomicroarcula sp. SYNS111]
MALDTVLLAVRPGDEGHGSRLAQTLIDIAEAAQARPQVGLVFTDEQYRATVTSLGVDDLEDVRTSELAGRHGTFGTVFERLEAAGLDFDVRLGTGPHGETIVDMAADADHAVVGGPKRSPTGKAVFGSTVQTVLFDAPCPVTYVRRE